MSDPMMAISYFQLAHLLLMSKRFDEAETEYENALKVLDRRSLHNLCVVFNAVHER